MPARSPTNNAARVRSLERQRQALELRRMGLGFEAIAAQLGIGKTQAHRLVVAGMADSRAQVAASADELRTEELSRLDGMLQGLWPRARKGEVSVVDRVLKIAERRAKLLGLDAPEKRELFGKGGTPLVPGALDPSGLSTQTLQELLAARDAAARRG
jgi:hypothetical protein